MVFLQKNWDGKAVNHVIVTQPFQRCLIGTSQGGVEQAVSPPANHMPVWPQRSAFHRLGGSGSIKLQLVFCNGPLTDVQQNQLSGQREALAPWQTCFNEEEAKL